MLPAHPVGTGTTEGILHVLPALQIGEVRLRRRLAVAYQHVVPDLYPRRLSQSPGQPLALVVTALVQSLACKRYGHYGIDAVEEVRAFEVLAHQAAEEDSRFGTPMILKSLDKLAAGRAGIVVDVGMPLLERCQTEEDALGRVVGLAPEVSERQLLEAVGAQMLFVQSQFLLANGAERGQDEPPEVAGQSFRFAECPAQMFRKGRHKRLRPNPSLPCNDTPSRARSLARRRNGPTSLCARKN